mmetsp:Transcript_168154/g.535112  ORF Transcript_168154/g.535112 Transcript_168154/m.535112 type:complete len:221 (-) Transcript_168154:89-751(-)
MLSGAWAESSRSHEGGKSIDVKVHWPRESLARLLRFLHGAMFVQSADDLRIALDCAKFFEVPSLFAHIGDWVASNLKIETAPAFWRLVEEEPSLMHGSGEGHDDFADADTACFEFHIRHFSKLAGQEEDNDEMEVVKDNVLLHTLSIPLMHRLLSSGLVKMHTAPLKVVVKRFAKAHTVGQPHSAYQDLWARLRPPAVLFNRDHRDSLLPVGEVTVRSFL